MKLKITLFFALMIAGASLFLGGKYFFSEVNAQGGINPIPEHILYESVFRFDLSFRKRALEQELTGQKVTGLKTYFKDEANLTQEEDELLKKISFEYLIAIQPVDNQAVQLLDDLRSQFPDGMVPEGQEVPPPPPALAALQDQRNAIALSHRDQLMQAFGTKRFSDFNEFVQGDFAANFQSIGPTGDQ